MKKVNQLLERKKKAMGQRYKRLIKSLEEKLKVMEKSDEQQNEKRSDEGKAEEKTKTGSKKEEIETSNGAEFVKRQLKKLRRLHYFMPEFNFDLMIGFSSKSGEAYSFAKEKMK